MRTTFNALMYSLALLLVIPPSKASAQVQFVKGAVGVIVDAQTGQEVGTGFSAENTSQVITCAHVIDPQRQYLYVPTGGSSVNTNLTSVLIRVAVALPRHDLIIMAAQTNFCTEPLHFGDFGKFRPGDRIIYLGLRNDKHVMQADTATVGAVGAAANEGTIVDFIEFAGVGVPGYSGGPVFDEKGKVVAVMREAWEKKGVKGGNPILINRAFSTDILKTLYNDIMTVPPKRTTTPGAISALLNGLRESATNNTPTNKPDAGDGK